MTGSAFFWGALSHPRRMKTSTAALQKQKTSITQYIQKL
jgi:hypothetical protein